MKLVIGNKNYSTWSLRAWLMLRNSGVKFEEIKLPLDTEEFNERIKPLSPTGKVPVLIDDDVTVWDSFSICEYVNEHYFNGSAWPKDKKLKAQARSICSEMHSDFRALRNELPMNIRARRFVELSPEAKKDIARIDLIWSEQMRRVRGHRGWLFGNWSIADAMFAPVVLRFATYNVKLSDLSQNYMDFVLNRPDIREWMSAALKEKEIVVMDEAGIDLL